MEAARILIVDDDESIRVVLAEFFREEGYLVETAANGRQALDAVDRSAFDVLLVDLSMPVMNGAELRRSLKDRQSSIPFIAMTAALRSTDALASELDATAYLLKPFDVEAVLKTVDGVLRAAQKER